MKRGDTFKLKHSVKDLGETTRKYVFLYRNSHGVHFFDVIYANGKRAITSFTEHDTKAMFGECNG